MGGSSKTRQRRKMGVLKGLLAEGKIASYTYMRDRRDRPPTVVVPGSCAASRVRRRGAVQFERPPGVTQWWMDSHGHPHPRRRDALRASDPAALREGFLPHIER